MKSIALKCLLAAGALTTLTSCACNAHRTALEPSGGTAECVDIPIESLPIAVDAIYAKIKEETGYDRSDLKIERICKYGNGYLLGIYPLARKNEFQRTILLSIEANGSIRFVPSK